MKPRFLLLGDSHAVAVKAGADSLGVAYTGGAILFGQEMNDFLFKIDGNNFEMLSEVGTRRLRRYLQEGELSENFLDIDVPIFSNIGFNAGNFELTLRSENFTIDDKDEGQFISRACFESAVRGARAGALEFYRTLIRAGKKVYAFSAPPRLIQKRVTACRAFDDVFARILSAMGVEIIDVRAETTDDEGILLPHFKSFKEHDWVHANVDYGVVVISRLTEALMEHGFYETPSVDDSTRHDGAAAYSGIQ